MGYRFVEHTADLGIEVWGESLDELFAEALVAFTDTLTEVERVDEQREVTIELSAPGLEELLVAWLEELLFLYETEGLLCRRAEVAVVELPDGPTLAAGAFGEVHDLDRQPLKTLVKAITYHRLAVTRKAGGYRAQVILDL